MVGRSVDKKDEIRAYIKARSKLGCSLKKLMTEISTAFGPSCVSYGTVRRWKKKFEPGVESIKNAPKSGRPKSASRKEIVSKIKKIIEGDARFTVRDIARKVGISLSTVHLIYTPDIRSMWGCIVFAFPFVCSFVCTFVFPSQGQSFCVKVYKTSYFEDPLMDFIHIWHDGRYRSKVFISTIPTPEVTLGSRSRT